MIADADAVIRRALAEARALGFLGPGEVEAHVAHAHAFAAAIGEPAERCADLGSGGGVPGLVLAARWPATRWTLIDASRRRTSFLARAVAELGWGGRMTVARGRAEELGHEPHFRGCFGLVVARSFGPPAATFEAGAPMVTSGGRLVVSEPPAPAGIRWPPEALAAFGAEVALTEAEGFRFAVITIGAPVPDALPRPARRQTKHPLF